MLRLRYVRYFTPFFAYIMIKLNEILSYKLLDLRLQKILTS